MEPTNWAQLRLLLEELCTELCRFAHVVDNQLQPESVRIQLEHYLGRPGAFADIRVQPAAGRPYVVEVKFGYSSETLLHHLRRKYAEVGDALAEVERVVLVIDTENRPNWEAVQADIARALHPKLRLEVWDEKTLIGLLHDRFQIVVPAITAQTLLEVRKMIARTKGFYAFGGPSLAEYDHNPLNAELLWHFSFWKLQQLREAKQLGAQEILPPGLYRGVAVLLSDLCSFSSYVRDTPDNQIVGACLTSFYSKSRYQIINNGGMLSQFVGDEVVGMFGIPEREDGYALAALDTACALVDIGNSVSDQWQRQIDRVQKSGGLHIGLALGDVQIVPLRPFSRVHVGAVGDCINVAARLMSVAGPSEIVVSNAFHQALDEDTQVKFVEIEAVEAKNVGRIKAWKLQRE